nr:MAG TPA: hypothetical protein [Bacteriophage sp.]
MKEFILSYKESREIVYTTFASLLGTSKIH